MFRMVSLSGDKSGGIPLGFDHGKFLSPVRLLEARKRCEQERSPAPESGARKKSMFPSDQQHPPQSREEAMHALGKFVEERHRITKAWVHWEYSPEEWALFDTVDWKFRKHLVIWLLIGVPLLYRLLGASVRGKSP